MYVNMRRPSVRIWDIPLHSLRVLGAFDECMKLWDIPFQLKHSLNVSAKDSKITHAMNGKKTCFMEPGY